jgi:hypothetical protein
MIRDGTLYIINRKQSKLIGWIPVTKGIWKVEQQSQQDQASAGSAEVLTVVSLHELHRSLAHIAPTAACKLV